MKAVRSLFAILAVTLVIGCVEPREHLPDARGDGGAKDGADGSSPVDHSVETGGGSDIAVGSDVSAEIPGEVGDDRPATTDVHNDVVDSPVSTPDAPNLKDNGSPCSDRSECKSSICVEGVCCDGACHTKCTSCLNANTGKPNGQCGAVKAGVAHGTDCAAADPSTCGLDGKCDGAGGCRRFTAGTVCKGESCPVGTSSYSSMSTCDGQGTCAPMTGSCGNHYKCATDGMHCRSNCSSDNDCTTTAYCDGSLCFADLNPGATCVRSDQCTSALCSGRCCNPGAPCRCPQPNPKNAINNAGLDKNTDGWALQTAGWDADDADGCPFSGSVNIASDDGFPMQCVPVLASTTYNFGAWFKVATDGGVDLCQIVFYDSGCGGAALGFFNLNVGGIKNAWLLASSSAMSPVATQYASIGCQGGNFKMDKLFVTPAPDTY